MGRFTGTDPGDHAEYDEPGIQVTTAPGTGTAASVRGTAAGGQSALAFGGGGFWDTPLPRW